MGKKILIVEDEKDIILVLRNALEKNGYEVIDANDGEQALEKVSSEKPDLVILDIMIPKLDGISVNLRLKDNPSTKGLPVIVITGKSHMEELLKIKNELSVAAYLEKPFSVAMLIEKISQIFQSGKR